LCFNSFNQNVKVTHLVSNIIIKKESAKNTTEKRERLISLVLERKSRNTKDNGSEG
jgi:hypothetical protein